MSKTGGNTEPMAFVRKWGVQANNGEDNNGLNTIREEVEDMMALQGMVSNSGSVDKERSSTPSRRDRSRSREKDRDRKKDRKKRSRSRDRDRRSRSRSRDRERRNRRSRSPRERRRRSRSRDRESRRPLMVPNSPKANREPIINPLVREDLQKAAQLGGAGEAAELLAQSALVPVATERKRERKSRWSTTKSFVPGMPTILPSDLSEDQRNAYLLQLEIEDSTRKLRMGEFVNPDAHERSPSPEPVYDANGKRLNTREVRKRQELEQTRHEKIQALLKINPAFKPPADYRPPNIRLHDKVFIPQEQFPEVNFVGLLIGPRGNTLKALEAETGAKIIIRGKGSVKEGKLTNRLGPMPGENEPLHAYVTGTDMAVIKKACEKIRQVVQEATALPNGNELRSLQLRELALLNGTFRPEDLANGARCSNCGSDEHKSWECPDAPNVTNQIKCVNCGGCGHISKDCKNPKGMYQEAGMDDEYSALMAELGEGGSAPVKSNYGLSNAPTFAGTGANTVAIQKRDTSKIRPLIDPSELFGPPKTEDSHHAHHQQNQGYYDSYNQYSSYGNQYQHQGYGHQQAQEYGDFYATSSGARGGAKSSWYTSSGGGSKMPLPVPPPAGLAGFMPPPPPPPPMTDLSHLLVAPAPPPPPPS
ncbi:unnamed protein product [Caenorhabditis angaria]|uniref:Branchpoint-bridging protein n=1 Tax=Caenorhabditis angaria TaxID=860376 RepID=A0A9P1INS4_9PELO|nr:unnamed protein product [Caenorhabditis angaria]